MATESDSSKQEVDATGISYQPDSSNSALLEVLLRLERDYHEVTRPKPPDRDVVQRTVQVLTLAGVGLYGAIRFGQQLYCDKLDIAPEEIGLTYIASLSRAAVIIVAITAPFFVFLALNALTASIQGSGTFWKMIPVIGQLIIIVGSLVLIVALANLLGDGGFSILLIGGLLLIGLGILGLMAMFYERISKRRNQPPLSFSAAGAFGRAVYPHRYRLAMFGALGALMIGAFLLAGVTAQGLANDVQGGRPLGVGRGLGTLGLRADPVRLVGNVPQINIENRRLMYLGQFNNRIVLYDVNCRTPLRLPDDNIAIVKMSGFPQDAKTSCVENK
jgi:hypothetical protein